MQDGLQDLYIFFTVKQTRKNNNSAPEIKTKFWESLKKKLKVRKERYVGISRYKHRTALYKQFWEEKYKYMQ